MRSLCNKPVDSFCNVCAEFSPVAKRKLITNLLAKAYHQYFQLKMKRNRNWCPQTCCQRCHRSLIKWYAGSVTEHLPFTSPTIWIEPKSHSEDCYICCTETKGFKYSTRNKIKYFNSSSSVLPILRHPSIAHPNFEKKPETFITPLPECKENGPDPDYQQENYIEPQQLTKMDLDEEVRSLNLPKSTASKFASRLKKRNLLKPGVKTSYKNRQTHFEVFYSTTEEGATFCNDITGLLLLLGRPTEPGFHRYSIF